MKVGQREFPLDAETAEALPAATARETVREEPDGTWSVVTELSWETAGGGRQSARLTTRIARGVPR